MCGIVGFVSEKEENAGKILFDGLRKLEYRGYDSAGIAVISGNSINLEKEIGTLDDFEAAVDVDELNGKIGISHTRWATHGGVTKLNAHPHLSQDGNIAIVHNGIIENYQELKNELKGVKFASETDTEVIVLLLQKEIDGGNDFFDAFKKVLNKIEGSYAILAMDARQPGILLAAKNESPLILGKASGKMFAASDSMPLMKHTSEVIYLEDGEIAKLTSKSFEVFDLKGNKISKTISKIETHLESSEKGMYPHFMLKEIMEQPNSLKRSLQQPYGAVEEFAKAIHEARGVMLIACGTALHAAMAGQYLLDKIAQKHVNVINASEFSYLQTSLQKNSLVIAISQSGETADVINALKKIKQKGAKVYSIVNVEGSSIARMSDKVIGIKAGPEIGVASTKAFTSQMSMLYQIAFALIGKLEEGRKEMDKLSGLARLCLDMNLEKTKTLAEKLANKKDIYFIGRGINYPIALEGALKTKEISYLHAEGMAAGELKHGTLALIEKGTPVIAINPNDFMHAETLSNAIETKARGALVIAISDKNNPVYDELLSIPGASEEFYPILSIIPLQLLAYNLAIVRGKNPDKPRNLAKSVTVK